MAPGNQKNMEVGTLAVGTARRRVGDWAGPQPAQALAVPNVTAHPSTVNVPITVSLTCCVSAALMCLCWRDVRNIFFISVPFMFCL